MARILFAGGGTAGHIEPAWAVSQVWHSRFPGDEIAFLGTQSGQEVELIPERGGKLFLIPKVTAPRKLNIAALTFPFDLVIAIFKAISIVKRFDLVVGFGGYVAAPAYLAALLLRKPIIIHDQNAKIGLANKLGARFARKILLAYPNHELQALNTRSKDLKKVELVGNPLKPEIIKTVKEAESEWKTARARAKESLNVSGPLVLVLGGSSGSMAINQVVTNTKFEGCTVIHSVGRGNQFPASTTNYRPIEYIEDMATVLLASDLVISRSGAIATNEFAALGKYALFIPLPIGNGEQAFNAAELVKANKAEILSQSEFTSKWLTENLAQLLSKGGDAPYGAKLNSAELIADAISEVLKGVKR